MLISDYSNEQKVDNYFFIFQILALIFGVVFYDFLGFKPTDELLAFFLVLVFVFNVLSFKASRVKPIFFIGFVSVFYLLYSFSIKSNESIAIVSDYVTQVKPFLGFFCVYSIAPVLSDYQSKILRRICFFVFIYMFIVGIQGESAIYEYFGHVSRFATCSVALSLTYLVNSEFSRKNIIISILLCAVGLFSGRAKLFGFMTAYIFLLYWFYQYGRLKFSLKSIIYFLFASIAVLVVSWEKINYYFYEGMFEEEHSFARPMLYITSLDIFKDYFPFGSGFASFATNFSAEYYSSIYEMYDLDMIWGLSPDYPNFIADSFYPSLAQFGVVGVVLFVSFFIYIIKSIPSVSLFQDDKYKRYLITIYSGVVFFIIECTTDTTFTHNRGFYILVLMGLSLAALKKLAKNSDEPE